MIDCLVPAAGLSERMGSWKPLLPFGDSTIVETVVANALAVCSRVILVVGYRGKDLGARFSTETHVIIVETPTGRLACSPPWPRG